jgi:Protein of unknown function (DUF3617).
MNRIVRPHTLLVLVLPFATLASNLQALELPAGKWGMNSETLTPMATTPITDYSEECIEEDFDPVQMLADSEVSERCEITPTTNTATEFASDLSCNVGQGGTSTGTMRITVNGEEASGEMQMSIAVNGQVMQLSNKWTGRRLGACD